MMGKKATDFDLLGTVRQNFNARHTFKSAVNAVAVVNYMKSLSSVTAK
jgi:calcium/calmodulin-dependent protein kinase I